MGRVSVSVVSSKYVIPFLSYLSLLKSFLTVGLLASYSIHKPRNLGIQNSDRFVIKNFLKLSMAFFGKTLSSLASDPLFSTIITFCTLILLYFPTQFLGVVFSPIIISTSFLLLSLLRLGAIQRSAQGKEENERKKEKDSTVISAVLIKSTQNSSHDLIIDNHEWVLSDPREGREKGFKILEFNCTQQSTHDLIIDDHTWVSSDFSESPECESVSAVAPTQKPFYTDCFVEWDVRAPLEVIYEEYEGEEEEEEEEGEDDENQCVSEGKREAQMAIIERYASLSKFYPETDSDISSEEDFLAIRDWDSPEHVCFQWEGEEKEGMIEIELGQQKKYSEVEEENLIEIDLYPASFPAR